MVTITSVLSIDDEGIASKFKASGVNHIRFLFVRDRDGKIVVAACKSPAGNRKMRALAVRTARGFSMRTPSFLRQHVGKQMIEYIDQSGSNDELFRLRPVGFSVGSDLIKENARIDPFFNNFNSLILPHRYLLSNGINCGDTLHISNLLTDRAAIDNGTIIMHVHKKYIDAPSSIDLRPCSLGLRMRGNKVFTNLCGGSLADYKYLKTVPWSGYQYGVIVFERQDNG